jgi:hypothetical protein
VLWRIDSAAHPGSLPPCPVFALTGLFCPGCGSTRAMHALLHGDLPRAFAMNPLMVVAIPLLALMAASRTGWSAAAAACATLRLHSARGWAIALLGYAVARNLPWAPFSALAPG